MIFKKLKARPEYIIKKLYIQDELPGPRFHLIFRLLGERLNFNSHAPGANLR